MFAVRKCARPLARAVARRPRALRPLIASRSHAFSDSSQGVESSLLVRRSGLIKNTGKTPEPLSKLKKDGSKSPVTPLVEELRAQIKVRGPLPLPEFMSQCLGNPRHGYYMTRDVFGSEGDFVTSPEISQMYGELVCIWSVSTWMQMDSPSRVHLIELGPGRGTLMADMLRSARQFKQFQSGISVHMVETSVCMREMQAKNLGVTINKSPDNTPAAEEERSSEMAQDFVSGTTEDGVEVHWHWAVEDVPNDAPTLLVAHEFYDALPVCQFQYTERGWCERMVDVDTDDGPHHFRMVLSNGPTSSSQAFLAGESMEKRIAQMQEMKSGSAEQTNADAFEIGDSIEVCPAAMAVSETITERLLAHGGAALVIDYGNDRPSPASLQGVKAHKFVDILSEPGLVDLTTLVDFSAVRNTMHRTAARQRARKRHDPNFEGELKTMAVWPLVTQREFLRELGIELRLQHLMENATVEKHKVDMLEAYDRLIGTEDGQMGEHFKVLCISQADLGPPVGFYELEGETEEEQMQVETMLYGDPRMLKVFEEQEALAQRHKSEHPRTADEGELNRAQEIANKIIENLKSEGDEAGDDKASTASSAKKKTETRPNEDYFN